MAMLHDIAVRWLALWNGDMAALDDLVAAGVVTYAVMVGQVEEAPMLGREALGGWIARMHAGCRACAFRSRSDLSSMVT